MSKNDASNPLPRHMRIAALQCDFEGGRENTLKVPELWNSFGFNVEQLFHTHGEFYSAVFQKDKGGAAPQRTPRSLPPLFSGVV